MGWSARSESRFTGSSSGVRAVTPGSLAVLSHGERHVVATEAEAVAQGYLDVAVRRLVRRVIEVAFGVRVLIIDRRRDDAIADHERADQEFQRASGSEHVPGCRLRGADVELLCVVAKHRLDRSRLVEVVRGR